MADRRDIVRKWIAALCVVALVMSQTSLAAFAADAVVDAAANDGAPSAPAELAAMADEAGSSSRSDSSGSGGGVPESGDDPAADTLLVSVKLAEQCGATGADGAFAPGDVVTFDIAVKNVGKDVLSTVKVRELLDAAVFIEDVSDDPEHMPAWTIDEDSQEKPAVIASIKPGAEVVVKATYEVSDADAAAGSCENAVEVSCLALEKPLRTQPLKFACAASGQGSDPHADPGSDPSDPDSGNQQATSSIEEFIVGSGASVRQGGVLVKTRGQEVQLGVLLSWSDFTVTRADAANDVYVSWRSDDESIATVDDDGLVTSQDKNGTVRIWAFGSTTSPANTPLVGYIDITYDLTLDEPDLLAFYADGTLIPVLGTGSSLMFDQHGSTYAQELYVEIELDGVTYSSRRPTDDVSFEFQIENIDVADCEYVGLGSCYVWADDRGYDGTTMLIATAVRNGMRYSRWIPVNVAAGDEYSESGGGVMPSSLTVSVSWEDDPNPSDPTLTEYEYTIEQLNEMATEYHRYTLIGDPDGKRKYGYQVARGVLLVQLLGDCGVYEQDIRYLDVKATDELSLNSQTMGISYFLQPRYYYPNFYLGRNTAGAIGAPAMIAMCERVYWNAQVETIASKVDTYAEIGPDVSARAPRLCVGAIAPLVTGGKVSVSNVEVIHVVLAGAPPVNPDVYPDATGEGDGHGGGSGGGTGGEGGGEGGGSGEGQGTSDGSGGTSQGEDGGTGGGIDSGEGSSSADDGQSGGSGKGQGTSDAPADPTQGEGEGQSIGSGTADTTKNEAKNQQAGEGLNGSTNQAPGGVDVQTENLGNGGGGLGDESQETGGTRPDTWKVYQMMSAARTQVPTSDFENKWMPFAVPLVDIAIGAGALRYLLWYRREKKPPERPAKPA